MSGVQADTLSLLSQNTVNTGNTANSPANGVRSIYPRGPGFTLDTFASKDFIVKDFVESLSEGAAAQRRRSGANPQTFDPKPFIRTFEHALTRLDALSEEREAHENDLSNAVRRAEAQHRQHCATLQRKLDEALESFSGLEGRLDSSFDTTTVNGYAPGAGTGTVALQIGERLEELDKQKKRAEDAKVLIQCWQDVSERGDISYLEDVRRLGGGEGKVKCAHIARQLLRISNRLSAPDQSSNPPNGSKSSNGDVTTHANGIIQHDKTNEVIERFLERLEKDLLEQFDESKRQHNEHAMRECATALYDFNDGASVIARYVNQHDFFLERSHMVTAEVSNDRDLWDRLADPDADAPGVELSLQSLVDEVKLVLEEESFTIKQVFPFHEAVLHTFIQRVFQQSIQQRLEMLLETANSVSSLAFLRTLQAARNFIGATIDDLKAHGLTEHPDPISPLLSTTLDQQLEAIFIPYFAGSSYIDREKKSLEELYGSLLFKFTLFHSKRRKAPTSYLGSLGQRGREMLSSARDSYIERLDSVDIPASQKLILMRISGLRDVDTKNKADIEVTEEDGILSMEVAHRMLHWLAEAVGRGLELSGGHETPKEVSVLLRLLFDGLGDIYLDTALDAAAENASLQENSRNEPSLDFIADARMTINILQLMMTVANSVLLPLAATNVTIRREMEKTISIISVRMEDKIGNIRARIIDVALAWVSKLLARQNKGDFRPRDDMISIEQLQTPICSSIFTFLAKLRDATLHSSEGKNSMTFFTELATAFRTLLLDHFKKFQVNLAGGLMVSKDITKYIELLRSFPLAPSFQPSLEVLVEIGNIFVIGPEALKDRLRGGSALTGIDKADLRPYILRRDDAGTVGVQSALNAL